MFVIKRLKVAYIHSDMGGLQGPCNRLQLQLLENIMIMITTTITRFLKLIDYDYDYIVK